MKENLKSIVIPTLKKSNKKINHNWSITDVKDAIQNIIKIEHFLPHDEIDPFLNEVIDELNFTTTNSIGHIDKFSTGHQGVSKELLHSYLLYMEDQFKGKDFNINKFAHEILETTQYIGNPEVDNQFKKKGLVFGQVQSGKTKHMIGVATAAMNLGYKLIIVLTSNDNALRKQTQERLEKDLIGISTKKSNLLTSEKKTGIGKGAYQDSNKSQFIPITTIDKDHFNVKNSSIGDNQCGVVILKKNTHVLNQIIPQLKSSSKVSTLLIDDEGDWGSINTKKEEEEDPSRINGLITEIIEIVPKITYISYTATPFANLITSKSKKSTNIYPEDFISYIEPGNGYKGFDHYFLNDDHLLFHALELENYKDDTEFFQSEEFKNKCNHFVQILYLSFFEQWRTNKKIQAVNILVNLSRIQENHKKIKYELEASVANCHNNFSKTVQWWEMYNKHQNLFSSIKYDEFQKYWSNFVTFISVSENYKFTVETSNANNVFVEQEYNNQIIVGGNKLSRGITFPKLFAVWYHRTSKNNDTILQMARWFGYEKLPTSPLLVISEELWQKFYDVSDSTRILQESISAFSNEGLDYSSFNPKIKTNDGQVTAYNKRRGAIFTRDKFSYSGRFISELSYFSHNYNDRLSLIENIFSSDKVVKENQYGKIATCHDSVEKAISFIEKNAEIKFKDSILKEFKGKKVSLILRKKIVDPEIYDGLYFATKKQSFKNQIRSLHTSSDGILDLKIMEHKERKRTKDDPILLIFYPFLLNGEKKIGILIKFPPYKVTFPNELYISRG